MFSTYSDCLRVCLQVSMFSLLLLLVCLFFYFYFIFDAFSIGLLETSAVPVHRGRCEQAGFGVTLKMKVENHTTDPTLM